MTAVRRRKSTIVRASYRRALRLTFGVLERVAPGPGAALAERLWCTIPRGRPVPTERPGHRFSVSLCGRSVVAETWGTGPAVYLMHGWGGRRGQFSAFVDPLVTAGFRVVALDAPSHGDSAPGAYGRGRGMLVEFIDALAAVVQVTGPAYAMIGHSLGGAATALAVLDGVPARQLVLVAPPADPVTQTTEFARTLGFGERIHTGMLRRLERRVGRRMSEFDIPARAAARTVAGEPLPPMLVVHDRTDRWVRHTQGEAIAAAWPRAELSLTTGLGHQRILRDAGTVQHVVRFLTRARVGAGTDHP